MRNPIFLAYTLAGGFGMAGLFAYISGSPWVVIDYLGYSETQFGWVFGINAFGFIAGSQINRLVLRRFTTPQVTLVSGMAVFTVVLLLCIGVAFNFLSGYGILGLLFSLLLRLGFLAPNTLALSLVPFKQLAGSASALMGTIRMLIGAISTALVSGLHDDTPLPMTLVIAGFSILSFISLILMYRFGPQVNLATGKAP